MSLYVYIYIYKYNSTNRNIFTKIYEMTRFWDTNLIIIFFRRDPQRVLGVDI